MADNNLEVGKPRIGWIADGDPATPELAVMLQDTGKEITLTVPYQEWSRTDPYRRWFDQGIQFGDDPERTKFSYRPPEILMFHDAAGPVVLVGCRPAGFNSNLTVGQGRIHAQFAVLGARHMKYGRINGMRSELPGLAEWAGIRSMTQESAVDDDNRLQSLTVKLESPPETPVGRAMNLTLRPSFRTSRPAGADTLAVHEVLQVQTSFKTSRPWSDHFTGHIAMRELLVVSGWQPFGFSRLWVNRDDDPERLMSGEPIVPRWAEVRTRQLRLDEGQRDRPRFLFTYRDIGVTGIRRWLQVRAHFERAMQPFVGIRDQSDAFWETRMVQSGIALEALGYQLAVDQRMNPNKNLKYKDALKLILDELPTNPLKDVTEWIHRSRDCYMGVKHADNPVPDTLVIANTLRENLLIVRLWIAGRLGTKAQALQERLPLDPHMSEYVAAG